MARVEVVGWFGEISSSCCMVEAQGLESAGRFSDFAPRGLFLVLEALVEFGDELAEP